MTAVDASLIKNVKWGNNCDSWALLRCPSLSVVQKSVPSGASEVAHRHKKAHQFFFVLDGTLTLQVEEVTHTIQRQQGISVEPMQEHKLMNQGQQNLVYLLISSPNSKGDRIVTKSKT